jgi:hypothetical protein
MTEVEGVPARDVGAQMGLSPNSAAQLAHRARLGLRERFLQFRLRGAPPECEPTVRKLAAYVSGGLSPAARAAVEAHLDWCEACQQRAEDLNDMGGWLKTIVLPLPATLGAVAMAHWHTTTDTGAKGAGKVGSPNITTAERVTRVVSMSTAGLLALGVITASLMTNNSNPSPTPSTGSGGSVAVAPATRVIQIPPGTNAALAPPSVLALGAPTRPTGGQGGPGGPPTGAQKVSSTPSTPGGGGSTPSAPPLALPPTTPPPATPPSTTAPKPPAPGLGLSIGANLSAATASISVSPTNGCLLGLSINGTKSCAPPAPASPGLSLQITTPLGTIGSSPAEPALTL